MLRDRFEPEYGALELRSQITLYIKSYINFFFKDLESKQAYII